MKRAFDIFFSLIGLMLLSPFFIFLSLCIKWDSPGPVFYRQKRVGKNNTDFTLLKFRSMYIDSDVKGLITIGSRDSRVTSAGYYLRKYKLDEFPQLINVLKGDMSIVGPRPEVRKYVDFYTPEQMKVLNIRPGITDLASIQYRNENELLANVKNPEQYYIDIIMQDKLHINLIYIKKMNFLYDIKLIFITLFSIF